MTFKKLDFLDFGIVQVVCELLLVCALLFSVYAGLPFFIIAFIIALHVVLSIFLLKGLQKTKNDLLKKNELLKSALGGFSKEKQKLEETEGKLDNAFKIAESANRAKSEFLNNMRHEIRTPMNAIIGVTDLVIDSDIDDSKKELLTMVRDSGIDLLNVINEIIDYSNLDFEEIEFTNEPFVLEDMVGLAVRKYDEKLEEKGLEVKTVMGDSIPGIVNGDFSMLTKVLSNLLGNAVKFTESGSITVSVELEQKTEKEDIIHFGVADTGIGISDELRDSIFSPFSQADGTYTRPFEGTGLGLSIAAKIVEKMGGVMWFDSEVGVGSHFHFIVRLREGEMSGMYSE